MVPSSIDRPIEIETIYLNRFLSIRHIYKRSKTAMTPTIRPSLPIPDPRTLSRQQYPKLRSHTDLTGN